jgi:hypothetical protein
MLEWLAQGQVGGVVLFRRNANPAQVAKLVQTCRCGPAPDSGVIDQEGGG